jgi:hypothetical protein
MNGPQKLFHKTLWIENKHNKLLSVSPEILLLLTWRICRAPNNASKWQMGFNSAFKGLIYFCIRLSLGLFRNPVPAHQLNKKPVYKDRMKKLQIKHSFQQTATDELTDILD